MKSSNIKPDLKTILVWFLSIIGIILGTFLLCGNFLAGLIIIISGLIIFPPIRSIYSKKLKLRLLYTLIISTIIFLCGFSYAIFKIVPASIDFQSSVIRKHPQDSTLTSENPNIIIGYECAGVVKKIFINDQQVSTNEQVSICNKTFSYPLTDGENKINITLASEEQSKDEILTINFDQKKYLLKQEEIAKQKAAEETKRKAEAEELAKQKAIDDAKIKAESEALAKEQARQDQLDLWRSTGEAVSGISPQQIKTQYQKQKSLSTAKGKIYLESLEGKSVTYAGKVSNVNTEVFGDGYYLTMKVEGISVFVNEISSGDVKKINTGSIIKVKATISSVSDFLGINIYLENARIEVVEK